MLTRCGVIFSGNSGQEQGPELLAGPEIMMVSNQSTYIHSVLIQSFCFSLSVYMCSVTAVMLDSLQPYGLKPSGPLCPWNSQARIMESSPMSSSRASSWSRDWTRVCYITCIGWPVLYHECHLGSLTFSSVQFSHSVISNSLRSHGLQHTNFSTILNELHEIFDTLV